jgi:hypothetical protein
MNTENFLQTLAGSLSKGRFPLDSEAACHDAVCRYLDAQGIQFERERIFDARNRGDIFFPQSCILIEIKVKGSRADIKAQCERYMRLELVMGLVLLTSRSVAIDRVINGKPAVNINMGRAWL